MPIRTWGSIATDWFYISKVMEQQERSWRQCKEFCHHIKVGLTIKLEDWIRCHKR